MAISDVTASKLMKIEGEIDEARLKADYSNAIPNLLKKWRKYMATPSTILEDVIHAESCLFTLLNKSPSPIPWYSFYTYPPAVHSSFIHLAKPDLSASDLSLINEATESVSRAYSALLQSQQLSVMTNPDTGLMYPSDQGEKVKTLFANSQLYLEIIVIKAQILTLRGFYNDCLHVLDTEIDLSPFLLNLKSPEDQQAAVTNPFPSVYIKGIGIIYLAMAFTLKAECLYFNQSAPNKINDVPQTKPTQQLLDLNFQPISSSDSFNKPFLSYKPPSVFPEASSKFLHSLLSFFSDLAPVDIDLTTNTSTPISSSTHISTIAENGTSTLNQNLYPFTLPIPELVMKSPHWSLMVHHGLFWGSIVWLQAWFTQVLSSPSPVPTFPYNLSFPLLTYQTLAFIRAFLHVCTLHLSYTEKPLYSNKVGHPKHPRECILVASWAVRFLVIWTYVVVQKDHQFVNLPLLVDYLPLLDPTAYYQASSLDQELEVLFNIWFKSIVSLHPFPKANVSDLPPALVNMLMEELVATLEWSDVFLEVKEFSIKLIETSFKHTFHSLLCLRILAMCKFRLGEVQSALTILQRYKEIAKEQIPLNLESPAYDYLYYPKLELMLRSIFKQFKIGSLSMFLTRKEGIEHFINFMIDGSISLAESKEFNKAIETIEFGKSMLKPNVKLPAKLISKLNEALGAIFGLMAQTTWDPIQRSKFYEKAKEALDIALQTLPSPTFNAYYQSALLAADQRKLNDAKTLVKLALKRNKSHLPSLHLLALLLTASRDYDNAVRILELGIRESISHHLYNSTPDSKVTTYDLICTLARDQRLNEAWTPIDYEEYLRSLFKLKITQAKILELKKGNEPTLSIIHELFRWYKVLFEEEIQIQDIVRLRSESVGSVNSNWLVASFSENLHVRLQSRRKRTLLSKAFLPNSLESDDTMFEERHRTNSSHSVSSIAKITQKNYILAHLWLCIAQILVSTHHSSETMHALQEVEMNIKHDTSLYSDVGHVYYLLSNPEKALEFWNKALADQPWDVTALLGLAKYHVDMRQTYEGSLILDELTSTSGYDCVDAWFLLGRIHKEQTNLELAKTCFLKALELQKTEPILPFTTLPRLSQSFFNDNAY
ncbi:hypothetical protein HMI54_001327 [Coelomomyces lativittatus]|nr:hypothetical protein HMI56_000754 [Coelomomyces lativittatus]KAJ1506334.1 hypothetical protein HMI55_001223 [Coelomomyces lativittatus]KAJ1518323.1 hypothetical protein HMI54_001327 [Coelomomyces lativittatus]